LKSLFKLTEWQCGYLINPMREEQRLTPAYEAGYEAGKEKDVEAYKNL